MGTIIASLLTLGFVGTWYATVVVVTIVPLVWSLAWIADLVPALRRRNVGNDIRRECRPRWW